jgi:hypothetical protein
VIQWHYFRGSSCTYLYNIVSYAVKRLASRTFLIFVSLKTIYYTGKNVCIAATFCIKTKISIIYRHTRVHVINRPVYCLVLVVYQTLYFNLELVTLLYSISKSNSVCTCFTHSSTVCANVARTVWTVRSANPVNALTFDNSNIYIHLSNYTKL